MIDFRKELTNILANDPLGLLNKKSPNVSQMSSSDRLATSFFEINDFIEKHGREPEESSDIAERKLYSRLNGIRINNEKTQSLRKFDKFNLLDHVGVASSIKADTLDDILSQDKLGLLGSLTDTEIFKLKNVKSKSSVIDKNAKRRACKIFHKYEPLFKRAHSDLSTNQAHFIPFESENQIQQGAIFLVQGMLVYVANVGEKEKNRFRDVNARLHCIFENGTESNMKLRSLSSAFWNDHNSRQLVGNANPVSDNNKSKFSESDKMTGFIYVLKSESSDFKVREIEDLYKIGYSRVPVNERVANAKLESTYLMSDVKLITQFEVFNVNPQKFEALLHRFLGDACLNIDIFDSQGNRFSPREWFIVPLHIIETTIKLIVTGEIINYRYDSNEKSILPIPD